VDRELLLVLLGALVFEALLPLGWLLARSTSTEPESGSAIELERRAARRLVGPVIPSLLGLCALIGWALVEPEDAEALPWFAVALALPMLFVFVRALRRAFAATRRPRIDAAATIGFLRPRVVITPTFAAELEPPVLEAVLAHEAAHARHGDPLRLWLAQLITDLQWPSESARGRLSVWKEALELARDEEARSTVDGVDLATGILAAARLVQPGGAGVAVVAARSPTLAARIERLLAPLPERAPAAGSSGPLVVLVGIAAAVAMGTLLGEHVIQALLGR
jgi:Zn-dependent protease with chaperone function